MDKVKVFPELMLTRAALTIAASLALSSCGDVHEVDLKQPAKVIDKSFIKAHTDKVSTGICAIKMEGFCISYVELEKEVPDSWKLVLEQCKGGPIKSGVNSICDTRTIEISETTYTSVEIGQVVTVTDGEIVVFPR